jgi:hypothetical protein
MARVFAPHTFIIAVGLVLGVLFGATVLHTQTPLFGWIFGAGLGLMGGAFVAALASGQQIISGPAPTGADLAREFEDYERDLPRLLDGLPPRRDAAEDAEDDESPD